ncbi:MAG: M23 family metallopeptidase [Flavobacteriaceae bacterium]|jgi:murein DD-endopeptidase MepM/ murein hydrolase activator NlpD|nr:M23 family metallopeptidase [Flavobacteriaceae bacterium]
MKQLIILLSLFLLSCQSGEENVQNAISENRNPAELADGFDFPVGKPDGEGYYDAQHFGDNHHLGEDWNGTGGGNTDLGDTIFSIANGKVSVAKDFKGGWGNVIRIVHEFPSGKKVESLYAHCDEIFVEKNQFVKRGQPIGTIGTADGKYLAHLHFEIREVVGMPLGNGYSENKNGYVNPSKFIYRNRTRVWEK